MAYLPPHVSEFPDTLVTDCVPSSGLMGVNKASRGAYPPTIAEREALQNAMGTQDQGATTQQLAAGIAARYGRIVTPAGGWQGIAAALTDPTKGLAILGLYPMLPLAIRNHGRQPSFNGFHAVYAQGDGKGGVIVGDPLADSYYYSAQPHDLAGYATAFPFGANYIAFAEDTLPDTGTGGPMTYVDNHANLNPKRTVSFAAGKAVGVYASLKPGNPESTYTPATASQAHSDQLAQVSQDPPAAPSGWYCHIVDGTYANKWVALRDVSLEPDSAPAQDCSAAVKAATDPFKVQVSQLQTTNALLSKRVADAKAALG